MSVIPARRQCDLCKNDIPVATPCARLTYPLESSELARLIDGAQHAAATARLLTGGIIHVPQAYLFDICLGCTDGVLPMLADLKAQFLAEHLRRRELAAHVAREEE